MSLSELPNELIQLIANNFVLHCDINAFSKVSRRLYSLLNPYLYFYNARYSDSTALSFLCIDGHTSLVRMMLDAGAPLNAHLRRHYIEDAALLGCAKVVELFLQRDVSTSGDIDSRNYDRDLWPDTEAVRHGPVLRVMHAYGFDLSHPLLLCNAAFHRRHGAVKFLAGLTSDLNGGEAGELSTPLQIAASGGDIENVRVLIDEGADPNAKDKGGVLTPICLAARRGDINITRMLLAHGADINVTTPDGRHTFLPLALAAIGGHRETAELLLKHIDLAVGEASQQLLPITGAACGLRALVEQVLLEGCDPDSLYHDIKIYYNQTVHTPLSQAAIYGHAEIVELLLKYGADPNAGQDLHVTQQPLSGAIEGGHEQVVQLLLDKGGFVQPKRR